MNIKVLKRLEELENKLAKRESPDFITIWFNDARNQYCIKEQYSAHDGKGNITRGGNIKLIFLDHYRKYIFTEGTHAQVIIDLMHEENGNLHTFNTDDIRKEAGLAKNTAFSIFFTGEKTGAQELEAVAEITPYERKVA